MFTWCRSVFRYFLFCINRFCCGWKKLGRDRVPSVGSKNNYSGLVRDFELIVLLPAFQSHSDFSYWLRFDNLWANKGQRNTIPKDFVCWDDKMLSYLVAFNKEILLDRITNAIQFATSIKQWRVPLLTLLLPFLKYAHCTGLNSFLKSIFYLYSFSILLDISSTFSTKSIAGFL